MQRVRLGRILPFRVPNLTLNRPVESTCRQNGCPDICAADRFGDGNGVDERQLASEPVGCEVDIFEFRPPSPRPPDTREEPRWRFSRCGRSASDAWAQREDSSLLCCPIHRVGREDNHFRVSMQICRSGHVRVLHKCCFKKCVSATSASDWCDCVLVHASRRRCRAILLRAGACKSSSVRPPPRPPSVGFVQKRLCFSLAHTPRLRGSAAHLRRIGRAGPSAVRPAASQRPSRLPSRRRCRLPSVRGAVRRVCVEPSAVCS